MIKRIMVIKITSVIKNAITPTILLRFEGNTIFSHESLLMELYWVTQLYKDRLDQSILIELISYSTIE